jgi:hypothetical protein
MNTMLSLVWFWLRLEMTDLASCKGDCQPLLASGALARGCWPLGVGLSFWKDDGSIQLGIDAPGVSCDKRRRIDSIRRSKLGVV